MWVTNLTPSRVREGKSREAAKGRACQFKQALPPTPSREREGER